jgi:hypothetical protein
MARMRMGEGRGILMWKFAFKNILKNEEASHWHSADNVMVMPAEQSEDGTQTIVFLVRNFMPFQVQFYHQANGAEIQMEMPSREW